MTSARIVVSARWGCLVAVVVVLAVATASAVGTIRILVTVPTVPVGFVASIALAFWLAFAPHTAVSEVFIRRTEPRTA